ncbi:lithostathine-like isoform X2 [Lagenorhynchus albirostris]|uniref:lithostathine-like isoform X2 n=1 Tax=Lagenorhynchus albirostris TaxID=27610 RepID=UPI0028E9F1BD|nr:lithostathine-like isoform X2 [Lagenorhynchus albirostris]XP_060025289.1 lithostathine-like isoform X2 [Lagenorhynchus albirostris]
MMPSMGVPSLSWMLFSCLMLLSQVQGEDSQKKLPSARISCPRGSMAYASYCYALFTTPKTWMNANGSEPNGSGWEWSSTDVLNYVAWEKDPSTSSSPGYCGSLSRNSGYLKWRHYNCSVNLPYVCKFKG